MSCSLDGRGQLTLMLGAVAVDAARKDLTALGNILAKFRNIFIADGFGRVGAECANTLSAADRSLFHRCRTGHVYYLLRILEIGSLAVGNVDL